MLKHFKIIIVAATLALIPTISSATKSYLFDWNSGSGTTMTGWTYYDEGEAADLQPPGWLINPTGGPWPQVSYPWGRSPRLFEKRDYGGNTRAVISATERAPSTSSGGSFRVYDDNSTEHRPGWWMWYTGEPFSDLGISGDTTDRWSFYIKLTGIPSASSTNNGSVFHVGTYLCKDTGLPSYGTGDGCPYEGPGNQHYYHYLNFSPDGWFHVELDQHPQHLRGSFVPSNDPSYATLGEHYLASINQFYMEVAVDAGQQAEFILDEMYFYSTQDSTECAEPSQNDISITSVSVGYFPSTGKWQIFWKDQSYETATGENTNDNTQSTFEVRWSTSPITNANYNAATPIVPEWFGGVGYSGQANLIRRRDPWVVNAYTQFELPSEIVNSNNRVYFAIKDVSVSGGNAGSIWPWTTPDGHNAPSSNIHSIDYHIAPSSTIDPSCSDGSQNGDETGIDCGGSCIACTSGNVSAWLTSGGPILTSGGAVLTPAQ